MITGLRLESTNPNQTEEEEEEEEEEDFEQDLPPHLSPCALSGVNKSLSITLISFRVCTL